MQRLRKYNLKLQPDKCEFLRKEVIYLGHIIIEERIHPDPSKLSAVKDFPVTKKIKDIQSFIRLARQEIHRKFFKNSEASNNLIKKGSSIGRGNNRMHYYRIIKNEAHNRTYIQLPRFYSRISDNH